MLSEHFLARKKIQVFSLLFIVLALNFNTLYNDYALDDYVVLTENAYVKQGFKGIPELLSKDLMSGVPRKNDLSQPRYRPVSLVVFAIEYQFFGENPAVSHLINVLLYALLIVVLFRLLDTWLFRNRQAGLAFLTCLLFAVHPVHAEVIANVKSRDELLTFLLLLFSLLNYLRYFQEHRKSHFIGAMTCYFLALLTRESAVTFLAVVALVLYFFCDFSIRRSLRSALPYLLVFIASMFVRYMVIGTSRPVVTDLLNSPFIAASSAQAFATKTFIILKYVLLLLYPHPLSCDYSFNQIPYIGLGSLRFISSFLFILAAISYGLYFLKSRSLLSFSIFYFAITISLSTNYFIDIGTPFSERLLFQPSLAFCIVTASAFIYLIRQSKYAMSGVLTLIVLSFSFKTIARNRDWKNNETLFLSDVVSAPNSARTNWAAMEIFRAKAERENDPNQKNELLHQSIAYGEKAIQIYPHYAPSYISLGFPYYYLKNFDKASQLWKKAYALDSTIPETKVCLRVLSKEYYRQGNSFFDNNQFEKAIKAYRNSTELNEQNLEAWYNLGGVYWVLNDTILAQQAWNKVQQLDPQYPLKKEVFLNH